MAQTKISIAVEAEDNASKTLRDIRSQFDAMNKDVEKLEATLANQAKATQAASRSFDDYYDSFKDLTGVLAEGVAIATAAYIALYKIGEAGARIERMADSFNLMAGGAGNAAEILEKLRAASNGTISDMELMATANRTIMLGVTDSAEEMAKLLEIAAIRGRAMGVSTTQAFNDLTVGIGRNSIEILDNLGIVVDTKKNYEEYARAIGKTTQELTKEEKTQALLNAVLADGNRILAEAGGLVDDNLSSYERFNASITNVKDSFGELLSGPFGDFLNIISADITAITKLAEAFSDTSDYIRTFGLNANAAAVFVNKTTEAIIEAVNIGIPGWMRETSRETDAATQNYTAMAMASMQLTRETADLSEETAASTEALELQAQAASQSNQVYLNTIDQFVAMEGKTAEQVEASTARIKFSLLERELSMDGLTDAETAFLLDMGVKWGVYTATAAAEAQKAISEVNRLVTAFNNVPTYKSMTIAINETVTRGYDYSMLAAGGYEFRAAGGSVSAGKPYIVGEQGAELFVPGQSGTIIPNSQMGGVVINMTYAPAISLASAQEAQDVLLPFIRDGVNNVLAGR